MNKRTNQGFTIIELLIVIVVIGILAALVLNTFSGIQARARDSERQTDIGAIATQLEVYRTDNGEYPLTLGTGAGEGGAELIDQGLDPDALVAPNSGETYTYSPLQEDGTTACTAAPCAGFTLTADAEEDLNDDDDLTNDQFTENSLS